MSKGDLELLRHVLDERRRAKLRWHWSSSIIMLYVEWCFLACMAANLSRKVVALGPAPLVQDKTSGTNEVGTYAPLPKSSPHVSPSSLIHGLGRHGDASA